MSARRFQAALAALLAWAPVLALGGGPAAVPRSSGGPAVWTQSILAYDSGLGRLFVAYADAARVIALDPATGTRLWEAAVGAGPGRLDLVSRHGRRQLFVSCEAVGEVWLLAPETGEVEERLPVGPTPWGFAVLGERYLVVALRTLHRLAVWDLDRGEALPPVEVGPFPTAVVADPEGRRIFVGHFFDGSVTVLDGATFPFRPTAVLPGAARANQLSSLVLGGSPPRLHAPHVLSHSDHPRPYLNNAVFPAVSRLDPSGRTAPETWNVALLERPVNGPEALALLAGGRVAVTANSRSNDLSLLDLASGRAVGHVEVGRFPAGLAVDPAEATAYVANAFDHTISVVDLAARRERRRFPFGEEVLPPRLARGRDLFHDADSSRTVFSQWLSCSNCHPRGHSDGRVWKLPGKPALRTKDLHGLADTLPAGWLATQDEMQDEELFIRDFQRGTGLSPTAPHPALGAPNAGLSEDLDALSAYVYSLRFAPSPHLERDGRLGAAATRGRRLFLSRRLGCAGCHPPPRFTVSALAANRRFRVASPTGRPVPPLDVPSLLGLYEQPRLLHDGRAGRPLEVLTRFNRQGRHGRTAGLRPGELADLEAFLLSLPYAGPR